MSQLLEMNADCFDEEVIRSEVPVLVDFWSPSCGPCRAVVPVLEEMAAENEGDAKIVKVNVAEWPQLGAKYGIEMLPTFLFFSGGNVVERMVGAQSKDKLQNALDEID